MWRDRPGAYAERDLTATVGDASVPLTIRSWADDASWGKRVGKLVQRALPTMGEAIGLPWPRDDTLVVQEAVSRSTGGYAGLFDPSQGLVEVAYYADDFVVLHESAHGWFNGTLLADRWANEAFASYYGSLAAEALGVPATAGELTKELRASAIPLNAWGPVGKETAAVEDYAYAATLVLARKIADRAGQDGLRAVWADASGRVGAYQPPLASVGPAVGATTGTTGLETVTAPPDWRVLLDLLEEKTPATYDDLWRTWVARDGDLPLLDDRAAARARYDAVVAAAADWQLPRPVRDAMRAWRFDEAEALLADAEAVLARRAEIGSAAADAGLTVPPTLRDAFQGDDGFADAMDEAAAEVAAIDPLPGCRRCAAGGAGPGRPGRPVGRHARGRSGGREGGLRGRRPRCHRDVGRLRPVGLVDGRRCRTGPDRERGGRRARDRRGAGAAPRQLHCSAPPTSPRDGVRRFDVAPSQSDDGARVGAPSDDRSGRRDGPAVRYTRRHSGRAAACCGRR